MSKLTDTYTGELNGGQAAALTRLKAEQFTGTLTYGILEKVGNDANGEWYVVRTRVVDPINLVNEAQEFVMHVGAGRAIQLAGTTTTAPTTSTTTAAA